MRRSIVRTGLVCVVLGMGLAASPGWSAEDEETPKGDGQAAEEEQFKRSAATEDDLDDIESIVTTGRRRAEFLQETPVSATVLMGNQLEERGINSLEEIGTYVPNLSSFSGVQHQGTFYSRGVGQRDAVVTLDPGVGIYVDDVYVARGHGALLPTLDLERIEVLRGPQGTLYGKNTIGGAIKLVSEKPGPEPSVSASFTGGTIGSMDSFGMAESTSTVNAPLVDNLLYSRFSFATRNHSGYTNNNFNDQAYNDDHMLGGRGQLRLLPHEYVTLDLSGHYGRERDDAHGAKCRISDPTVAGFLAPFGLPQACQAAEDSSTYDFSTERDDKYRLDTYGTSLVADWELGSAFDVGNIDVKSISSFQEQKVDDGFLDLDATELSLLEMWTTNAQRQRQLSQELQTTASAFNDLVKLTSGVYGFWENTNGGDIESISFFSSRQEKVEIQNASYAVYSQGSWTPFPWVELTSGLRWTWEEKSAHRTIDFGESPGEPPSEHASDTFNQWTPMAGIAFRAPDELLASTPVGNALVYFSWAQGYKSGGFSTRRDPSNLNIADFDPEELDNFEVGFKLDMLEDRVTINTAFFYSLYDNMQLTVARVNPASPPFQPDIGSSIGNAGESHIKGMEVEAILRPLDGLVVRTSFGLTDGEYDEFVDQTWDINPGTGLVENVRDLDRSGEELFNVPNFSVDATVEYTIDAHDIGLPRAGSFTPIAHVYYQDSTSNHFTSNGFDSNRFRQRPYTLLDLRMIYDLPDDHTQMAFFVNNVLGTEYFDSAVDLTNTVGIGGVYMAAPRTMGGEIRYRWSAPSWSEL
ncbi:MAG TPA: TonB-dependent receptor [Myxococcota bacterium]|nr:TonB-dependent receptor [Myxococcota bacterium]